MVTTLAAGNSSGFTLALTLFAAVVITTMFAAVVAGPTRDEVSEFYLGDRELSPLRNGLAMCGNWLSAATLLGGTGLVALTGYDGLLYLLAHVVAWMLVMLLIAEPLRNSGKFTLGDTLALRLPDGNRSVRIALAACTVIICVLYLVAQLVGSVAILGHFMDLPGSTSRTICVIIVGALVIAFVAFGGMPGATFIQIVKAAMLVVGLGLAVVMVMAHYHWDVNSLLGDAADRSKLGETFLHPGLRYGGSTTGKLDLLSSEITVVLALPALPHIITQLLAPRRSHVARRSVLWAIGLVGIVCLAVGVVGLGAAGIVGRDSILRADPSGSTTVLLLAKRVGGDMLNAIISSLAFVTLMAVAAGLTLAAASSLAHDVYAEVIRKGRATELQELAVARLAAVLISVLGILLALMAWSSNTATLGSLAFALAASAILPTIVYALFWRRFNARGALLSLYGGLACTILLVVFSPVVSSTPDAFFPSADFAWFPLHNPGIASIPAGFLLGWLGTLLSPAKSTDAFEEFEYRSLVGAE
jgi:cation/acetate symporter